MKYIKVTKPMKHTGLSLDEALADLEAHGCCMSLTEGGQILMGIKPGAPRTPHGTVRVPTDVLATIEGNLAEIHRRLTAGRSVRGSYRTKRARRS